MIIGTKKMFMYSMDIPFSIGNGSDYTAFKRNKILYSQYVLDNPKAKICNTAVRKGQYLSYALKQEIHHGCMDRQNYCLKQCDTNGVMCPCDPEVKKLIAPSITVVDKIMSTCFNLGNKLEQN